jgi:glycerate-2-kinase
MEGDGHAVSAFTNHAGLASHGLERLRSVALEVAAAGLAVLDPALAVDGHLAGDGRAIVVDGRRYEPAGRVVVLGAGKASLRIAGRIEEILGDRVDDGMVVVRRGEGGTLRRIKVVEADHPVPSDASVAAAKAMLAMADELGPDDLALCCITGGSSALICAPPPGVPVEAKERLHEVLLASGLRIDEMNTVRKHVSSVKGGRLAARIHPAKVVNMTVSDVVGDTLDLITDPTVQDTTTVEQAIAVLRDHGLWDRIDQSVKDHLVSNAAVSPDTSNVDVHTTLLVVAVPACREMSDRAKSIGYRPHVVSASFDGCATETGRSIAEWARSCLAGEGPTGPPCVLIGCGGESTVGLGDVGEPGMGGPNQEVVLAAAAALDPAAPVAVLAIDTDGSDGGTPFAGGIADAATRSRAEELGESIEEHLSLHTSGRLLGMLDDLIETGPTGTNVNDLIVAVVGRK